MGIGGWWRAAAWHCVGLMALAAACGDDAAHGPCARSVPFDRCSDAGTCADLAPGTCVTGADGDVVFIVDDAGMLVDPSGGMAGRGALPIPRLDGGMVLRSCAASSSECRRGETCEWAIVEAQGQPAELELLCLETPRQKALGVPCSPWVVHQSDGIDTTVYADPCGAGSVCAPDPTRPGISSCQPDCPHEACGGAAACLSVVTGRLFQAGVLVCREADGCDPVAQRGCQPGQGCYMLRADDDSHISLCLGAGDAARGETCSAVNECRSGLQCAGLLDGADGALRCRAFCHPSSRATGPDAGGMDAGMTGRDSPDAGAGAGDTAASDAGSSDAGGLAGPDAGPTEACPSAQACVPYGADGSEVNESLSAVPGLCQ